MRYKYAQMEHIFISEIVMWPMEFYVLQKDEKILILWIMIKNLNKTTVERAERPVRILQFGEGNFLRALADSYLIFVEYGCYISYCRYAFFT